MATLRDLCVFPLPILRSNSSGRLPSVRLQVDPGVSHNASPIAADLKEFETQRKMREDAEFAEPLFACRREHEVPLVDYSQAAALAVTFPIHPAEPVSIGTVPWLQEFRRLASASI